MVSQDTPAASEEAIEEAAVAKIVIDTHLEEAIQRGNQ